MKVEVLVSAMHQTQNNIMKKMNIRTNAIIINQCENHNYSEFNYQGNLIKFFSFKERGVGLSRNNALMRATGDICLFADEDVSYLNNYNEIIIKAFKEQEDADIILFNVPSTNPKRLTYEIKRKSRVRWFNSQRYGAVKMAVRTNKIKRKNIYFSLLFGGGAIYSAGEDSLFISNCLKQGLKIYTNPDVIGYVSQEDSSWFEGYTEKYFVDKGIFYATLSKKLSVFLCLQYSIKKYKLYKKDISGLKAFLYMIKGVKKERTF